MQYTSNQIDGNSTATSDRDFVVYIVDSIVMLGSMFDSTSNETTADREVMVAVQKIFAEIAAEPVSADDAPARHVGVLATPRLFGHRPRQKASTYG